MSLTWTWLLSSWEPLGKPFYSDSLPPQALISSSVVHGWSSSSHEAAVGPREMIVTKALCKWRMLDGALRCSRNVFHLAQNLGDDAPLAHTLDIGIYTFQATCYLLLDLHCPQR